MKWTKETPTVSGYYWMRSNDLYLVKIGFSCSGGEYIQYHGTDYVDVLNSIGNPDWCGPIEPPEETP